MLHIRMRKNFENASHSKFKYIENMFTVLDFSLWTLVFLHGVSGKEGNGFVPQIYKTDIFHDDTRGKARRSANSHTNNRDM